MNKKLLLAVIVLAAVVVLAAAFLLVRKGTPPLFGGVIPLKSLTVIPPSLVNLLDFGDVKPFNLQEADLANGAKQYIVSFNSRHLRENYDSIKEDMVKKNGFSLISDVFQSDRFVLDFKKGERTLEAKGVPPKDAAGSGTIIITLYEPS